MGTITTAEFEKSIFELYKKVSPLPFGFFHDMMKEYAMAACAAREIALGEKTDAQSTIVDPSAYLQSLKVEFFNDFGKYFDMPDCGDDLLDTPFNHLGITTLLLKKEGMEEYISVIPWNPFDEPKSPESLLGRIMYSKELPDSLSYDMSFSKGLLSKEYGLLATSDCVATESDTNNDEYILSFPQDSVFVRAWIKHEDGTRISRAEVRLDI